MKALGWTGVADMNCSQCGATVPDESRQCPACDTALEPPDPVGTVKPGPVPAKSGRAYDATAASLGARRVRNVRSDALTALPTLGSTPPLTPNDSAGLVDFGPRYHVERLLGQGGMGAVYLNV